MGGWQMSMYYMGSPIRPDMGDYHVYCETCLQRFYNDRGLNTLDQCSVIRSCNSCMGTNRCPIPLAEVLNIRGRKMENKQ